MTRREWLGAALIVSGRHAVGRVHVPPPIRTSRDAVDHLLLGAPDLDAGIAWFESRTGVRAVVGGSHPGVGTRNALASLGDRQYLEIIAPDPGQSAFNFNIDLRVLHGPRLVTWAASATDVDLPASAARSAGLSVFGPRDGSRARPDGTMLRWRSVGVRADLASAEADVVPFFIQWGTGSRHPSSDSPVGCRLAALELRHPDPARVTGVLATLGIEALVTQAPAAGLRATLDTPKGKVVLE